MVLGTPKCRGRVRVAGHNVTTKYWYIVKQSLEHKEMEHTKDTQINILKREMAEKESQMAEKYLQMAILMQSIKELKDNLHLISSKMAC